MGFFFTSSHFISQFPPTRFPLITAIRMCHFLPVHHLEWHFWPGQQVKHNRNTKVKVRSPDGDTDYFDIVAGVLQGDTLALYIYMYIYMLLNNRVKYFRIMAVQVLRVNWYHRRPPIPQFFFSSLVKSNYLSTFIKSCLVLYTFGASLLHSFIM